MSLDVALSAASSGADSEAGDLVNLGRCILPFVRNAEWILWFRSFLEVIVQYIAVTASALCVTKENFESKCSKHFNQS